MTAQGANGDRNVLKPLLASSFVFPAHEPYD